MSGLRCSSLPASAARLRPRAYHRHALRHLVALAALAVLGCGRAAVDKDSSDKPASSVALGAAARSSDPARRVGVWSISELEQHRELERGHAVSIEGVLIHVSLCYPCPENIPCAPCGSFQLLGETLDSPREKAILFVGSLLSEHASEFQVGKHYIFKGTLRDWDDAKVQPKSFATFDYVSHRASD